MLKYIKEPFVLPIISRLNHEICAVNKKRPKCSIVPISCLPADLCNAWDDTIGRLHAAFFLAHDETDNLQDASYYIAHNRALEPCSSAREIQNFQELKVDRTYNICDSDDGCFQLSIDSVEYFPQPPIARADPSSWTLTCASGQPTVERTISRPGRTYV